MRRTCAKLCPKRVGDLEHIKILAGSCVGSDYGTVFRAEQDFIFAVNDNLGLER
jgi:hypothetical protein